MADNSGPFPPHQGGPYQPYPQQQPGQQYPPPGQYSPPPPSGQYPQPGPYPQPGQGQPPGGQYPGGGYPQYQQPPPPPQGNKTGLIIAAVVGAVVLIAGGIFAATRLGGDDEPTAGTNPSTSSEPSEPASGSSPETSTEPSGSDSPGSFASPPAAPACNGCFPGVKVATVLAALTAKGYVCKPDSGDHKCQKNDGDQYVRLSLDYKDKTLIRRLSIAAFQGGPNEYPQGEAQAIATLKADVPKIVPLVIKDRAAAQQVSAFIAQRVGRAGQSKVGQYRVDTDAVDSITVRGKTGKTVTSWNCWAYVEGPSDY